MPASLYLALAYLKPKRSVLSVVNAFAVMGTMLAVATLLVVTSVMNGFDAMWGEKILSFTPHVTVYSYFDRLEEDSPIFDQLLATEEITAAAPFIQSPVVTQLGDRSEPAVVRGVDHQRDFLLRKMEENDSLRLGSMEFDDEQCLVGAELARRLGVQIGDELTIYSPSTFAREQEIVLPEELEVVGIFQVGFHPIDEAFLVTTLDTARDVLAVDTGVDGIQLLGTDLWKSDEIAEMVGEKLDEGFYPVTWKEMNQQLFDALTVEKSMMFFLLSILVVVSSFLVSNTLIMASVQKTREIGLLKSFGFRSGSIMATFTWYGLIQGILGMIAGISLGLMILHFRNDIMATMSDLSGKNILPAGLYFLSELPAQVERKDLGIIVGLVVSLSLLCSSVPAYLAARKNPVEALRHE